MSAAGPAVITSIRPCPSIEPDDGTGRRVVTGRFVHAPDGGLLDLLIEGEATPTGVTDNHPYWSVTRQQFVEAGQLEVGEQIDTLTGPRRIHQISPRIQRETVYNLEVHSEHVYRVGSLGTLVHNTYPRLPDDLQDLQIRRFDRWMGGYTEKHHPVPKWMREILAEFDVNIRHPSGRRISQRLVELEGNSHVEIIHGAMQARQSLSGKDALREFLSSPDVRPTKVIDELEDYYRSMHSLGELSDEQLQQLLDSMTRCRGRIGI